MSEGLFLRVTRKILTESLRVKKGETLTIETWDNGLPLGRHVLLEARRMGAIPILLYEDAATYTAGVKAMPHDVLGTMGRHEYGLLAGSDAYVFIPGPPLSVYYPALTREEFSASTQYNLSWYEAAEKAKLRGVRLSFGYVGPDLAKLLGKSVRDVVGHLLEAALVDSAQLRKKGEALATQLVDEADATVVTDGSQLSFRLKGDLVIEDGVIDDQDVAEGNNMAYIPAGLVSKQVDSASVSGQVKLSAALTRLGLLRNVTLEFGDGRVRAWRSATSQAKLDQLFEAVPESARIIRGLAVGLNPAMAYGFSQDRFVAGAIWLGGFGFSGVITKGRLVANNITLVEKGKLA